MRIIKKILLILIAIFFAVIAGYCFYFGYILNNEAQPKSVFSKIIYKLDDNIFNYLTFDKKYYFGDNFSVTGDIKYELDGSYYLESSKTQADDIKIYNKIRNLSNSKINFKYIQNDDEDKLYSEYSHYIGDEQALFRKTYIDNATEYEFINTVSDKYINNGNSVFYETINSSNTLVDNINYMHKYVVTAFVNSLKEEFFAKERLKTNIGEETKEVYQMSLRIDNVVYRKILNGIIKEIRKDERANKIATALYNDFANYKIDPNKMFLEKDEIYIINVYTDVMWCEPLKYELIYLEENSRKTYSYIGDLNGELTYVHNDELKYFAKVTVNHKIYELEFTNKSGKNIGKIKLDKNEDMYNLDVDVMLDKKRYFLTFSTKIKDYKENESYTINNYLNARYSENDIVKFSGNVNNKINVNIDNSIKEDVGDVIIRTALTEAEENNYKNYFDNLKLRLER